MSKAKTTDGPKPSYRTLEHKLQLSAAQAVRVEAWLAAQQRVWNLALEMLIELEQFSAYSKAEKQRFPSCPLPWEVKAVPSGDPWDEAIEASIPAKARKGYRLIPYSYIGKPERRCCPIPQPYREPRLLSIGSGNGSEFDLITAFAYKLHADKPWLLDCPSKMTHGTLKRLSTSWMEYLKGKRDRPRFIKKGQFSTLSDVIPGDAEVLDGDRLKLPKLGKVRAKALTARWLNEARGAEVRSFNLKREPSGFYVYLVGEIPSPVVKPSTIAAGFDAGVGEGQVLHDDAGVHVAMPLPLKRKLKKLKRLQRKVARQQQGSANQAKARAIVARLHEGVRRERKAWHHKLSTFAVRKFGAIAVEDLQLKNMSRRAKPKPDPDKPGHFLPNNAAAKSGLNRSLLDAGLGGLLTMLEGKAKQHEREFMRVPAANTSRTCNQCGAVDKASRNGRAFKCCSCGHEAHADTNAARNIRDAAFPEYRALHRDFKPVEPPMVEAMKQEGEQSPAWGDAPTIPPFGGNMRESQDDAAAEQPAMARIEGSTKRKRQRKASATRAPGAEQLSLW
jgi:putative transposase